MPPVERSHSCGCHFFVSYRWELIVSEPLFYNVLKKKKNWDKFDPQSLKTHIWSSSVILNGHSTLWKMGNVDLLKGFNYNTVLQLDWFCRKEEKWVIVTYMFLFISLWDTQGLCPKSTDLGVKPSAPSSSLTLPLDLGLPTEQAENQDTLPGGVASVLVEI